MKAHLSPDELIVAIDIGTTKICVLIARQFENNVEILGIGKAPSIGLARGVVVDIAPAVHSIKTAIKEAELMSGYSIESAYIGISGSHIQAFNSHGMIPIKNGEIRPHDVAQVLAAAKAVPLKEGQQILHALPQFYTIDAHHRVKDPIGMFGIRLEAQVHIITGAIASVQNLVRCCEMAGVKARDIILEPLASADAVLSTDEQELGIGLLDIGGGTADLALYQNGSIRHTKIFPIAGNLFTHDIALCLRTTLKDAERIKKEYGIAHPSLLDINQQISAEMVQGGEQKIIWLHELLEVLEPRTTELMQLVQKEITSHHLESFITAGLVITGGGSLLIGIKEVAQEVLQMPIRIGKPQIPFTFKEALDSPIYATGYGLLIHAIKKNKRTSMENLTGPLVHRVFHRMKSWVFDFF